MLGKQASCLPATTGAWPKTRIYVPLLTYRTGPFAGSGHADLQNGLHDYLTMLNERDGGDWRRQV